MKTIVKSKHIYRYFFIEIWYSSMYWQQALFLRILILKLQGGTVVKLACKYDKYSNRMERVLVICSQLELMMYVHVYISDLIASSKLSRQLIGKCRL